MLRRYCTISQMKVVVFLTAVTYKLRRLLLHRENSGWRVLNWLPLYINLFSCRHNCLVFLACIWAIEYRLTMLILFQWKCYWYEFNRLMNMEGSGGDGFTTRTAQMLTNTKKKNLWNIKTAWVLTLKFMTAWIINSPWVDSIMKLCFIPVILLYSCDPL